MKNGLALMALILIATATGCQAPNEAKVPQESLNAWLVASVQNPQIDNAIIAQHTLYPYHFIQDSAELNELGVRDLQVLAEHFHTASGELNVNRGSAGDDLYAARVTAVVNTLAKAGVTSDRVQIADKLPGGEGMCTERLVKIMAKAGEQPSRASASGSGMSSWSGK